jgi:hypothetical protein
MRGEPLPVSVLWSRVWAWLADRDLSFDSRLYSVQAWSEIGPGVCESAAMHLQPGPMLGRASVEAVADLCDLCRCHGYVLFAARDGTLHAYRHTTPRGRMLAEDVPAFDEDEVPF